MGIYTDKYMVVDGIDYSYSIIMHNKINKLADIFYQQQGYASRPKFDYISSPHPTERLMYSMALQAFIFTKKVKPTE